MGNDDCFYTMLLTHLSKYYYPTIEEMSKPAVDALFVMACDLFRRYGVKRRVKLPYVLRAVEKSLATGDMALWKLATKYL